jgi:tetratricopeptide (TPR) repeat protein
MKNLLILISISIALFSCKQKVDYNNPKEVVLKYRELRNENKIKESFELIADTCKTILTLQEYLDYYNTPDSIFEKYKFQIEINQLSFNTKYPNYRVFEVTQKSINTLKHDTIIDITYYTTFYEKNKWKILWTNHINAAANKLASEQKFADANKLFINTFDYDPLNGDVYYNIAWNYFRLNNLDEAQLNVNKAIELSPKSPGNYCLQAAIYSSKEMYDLAIENYNIALVLCTYPSEKSSVYSNMSNDYIELNQYEKAKESLIWSIKLDSGYAYSYWRMASLYLKLENKDSAIIYFAKAINSEPMGDYSQKQLYYEYANEIYLNTAKTNSLEQYHKAKTFALKALNIEPNEVEYIDLLNKINKAIESSTN